LSTPSFPSYVIRFFLFSPRFWFANTGHLMNRQNALLSP
jgi:hypothetical protein